MQPFDEFFRGLLLEFPMPFARLRCAADMFPMLLCAEKSPLFIFWCRLPPEFSSRTTGRTLTLLGLVLNLD